MLVPQVKGRDPGKRTTEYLPLEANLLGQPPFLSFFLPEKLDRPSRPRNRPAHLAGFSISGRKRCFHAFSSSNCGFPCDDGLQGSITASKKTGYLVCCDLRALRRLATAEVDQCSWINSDRGKGLLPSILKGCFEYQGVGGRCDQPGIMFDLRL